MNNEGLILSGGIALCALMAVGNLLKFKSRGQAAFAMAGAFVTFGSTLYLIMTHRAPTAIYTGIGITVVLLGLDFGLRAPKQGPRP